MYSEHMRKHYAERLIDEFDGIKDWHKIIMCETDEKRLSSFITYITEEKKHYDAMKEALGFREDDAAMYFVCYMDNKIDEIMENVAAIKSGKKS